MRRRRTSSVSLDVRASRNFGVLIGARERGPVVSAAVVMGSLVVLALSVFSAAPLGIVAPVTLLAVVVTTGFRRLLRWDALICGLLVVVLFIPIRRYMLPGSLPFQL